MNIVIYFWISEIFIQGCLSVKITNFFVPNNYVIREEGFDPLVLDCEYQLDVGDKDVVVKWFKDDLPIYQWIYGSKPSAFSRMRYQIEEGYKASEDEYQEYRALSIINPTWNNTGIYECRVHTTTNFDFSRAHLQIIDISNFTIDVSYESIHNETEVFCSVKNIYPKPKLNLWTVEDDSFQTTRETFEQNEFGYFNAVVSGVVSSSRSSNSFECSLHIPGTNFSTSSYIYSNSIVTTDSSILKILLAMTFAFIISLGFN